MQPFCRPVEVVEEVDLALAPEVVVEEGVAEVEVEGVEVGQDPDQHPVSHPP